MSEGQNNPKTVIDNNKTKLWQVLGGFWSMYNSLKEVLGMHLIGISNKPSVLSQCSTLKEALVGHTLLTVLTSCLEQIVGHWSSISMPYLASKRPTLLWNDNILLYAIDERYYMLGGHFMEAVPLRVEMECFVDMACRSYFHFELFDFHVDTLTL